MVRTRSGKSESSDSELEEGCVESCDVREAIPRRGLCEEEAIGLVGRGGRWCQPPGTLSSAMDIDVWLGRLHDYLTANAIPKARWVPITKSLVDDKIYKSLNCLGQECTNETLKSHLRRRFGKDDSLFVQRLQFFQRVQKPEESVHDFADELRCLGAEVGKQDDDLKEQFIMGLQDTAAQRHLLDKRPDSFDQAVQIAKQYRAAQASVENMQKRRRLMMTGGCQDGKAGNRAAADHGITHRIPTQAVNPITCRPYRVSSSERKAIAEQVNEMMRDGIVERSSSPWSFPVVMVQKRDSTWRFCVDYRRLNAITIRDVYPMPRMDDVLDRVGSARDSEVRSQERLLADPGGAGGSRKNCLCNARWLIPIQEDAVWTM
ncbi:hypothetical protein M513_13097 [Trichuris suis]|uniref:Retrotransposon gag domain-containing protein n=1 Tax=Trichuris suis TaxID=68888 RepID=A0A085LM18_9BILA|nr:hypothetical protein M513_13097 [Trichuris suis]